MGVDLHIHTTASDGTLGAGAVVAQAHQARLSAIAITDHDTTDSLAAAQAQASSLGLEVIPGIEINTGQGSHCHILGYCLQANDPRFQQTLAGFRAARRARIAAMVAKLQRHGVNLTLDDVLAVTPGDSVGRPHIADALRQKGYVGSRGEAFQRYLQRGGPAYVPSLGPTPQTAICTIREAKGIPVVAHPATSHVDQELPALVEAGLMGIEVYYPELAPVVIAHYQELAVRYRLLVTGGSDFHGPGTGRDRLGVVEVPDEVLVTLKNRGREKSGTLVDK